MARKNSKKQHQVHQEEPEQILAQPVQAQDHENVQHGIPVQDLLNASQQLGSFPSLESLLPGGLSPGQALAFEQFQAMHGVLPVLASAQLTRRTVKRRKPVKWELWEEKNLIEGVKRVYSYLISYSSFSLVVEIGLRLGQPLSLINAEQMLIYTTSNYSSIKSQVLIILDGAC